MAMIPAEVLLAAAARLRGQLVAAPVFGGVMPGDGAGADARPDVRWKADLVQPGGSGWFRGYLHLLQRSYGSLPGVTFAGPLRRLLAAAEAARLHRLPFAAFAAVDPGADLATAMAAAGIEVRVVADPAAAAAHLQRQRGFLPLPGCEHVEVAAGMATAALEFGAALPGDCAAVYVPVECVDLTVAGLAAAGRQVPVLGAAVEDDPVAERQLRAAVQARHSLVLGSAGVAVLRAALGHRGGGVPGGAAVVGAIVFE